MADPRWPKKQIILTTLFLQLCAAAIVMAMGLHGFLAWTLLLFPVPVAGLTVLSAFVHLVCFWTGALHPLVVLTLAILFMIAWLAVVIFEAIFLAIGDEQCGRNGMPSGYWDLPYDYGYGYNNLYSSFGVTKGMVCQRYIVSLTFSVLAFVLYFFLVIYSAIRRKRTAMPYVPPQKLSMYAGSAAYNPDLCHDTRPHWQRQDRAQTQTASPNIQT